MRLWMALAALLPACGFGSDAHNDAGGDDDAPNDAQQCFGSYLKVCFTSGAAIPTLAKMFGDIDINTDDTSGAQCNQLNDQASNYCVVAGAGFTLMSGKRLTAHGAKPLVLLSTMTIDVLGDIDVSSHHAGPQPKGPGANPAAPGACSFATAPTAATQASGGYGGSFGTKGGDGSNASPASGVVGLAGSAAPTFPMALQGGCKGGDGAIAGTFGTAGDGGGAVALIAMQVHVEGKINASGAGGHAGMIAGGAGGGGSGGMIVVDSTTPPMFGATARLWANGGGGGQGGAVATPGTDGSESPTPAVLGAGGFMGDGATGGNGSLGTNAGASGGNNAPSGGGGGGGGGGAGFIRAPGLTDPVSISPPSIAP